MSISGKKTEFSSDERMMLMELYDAGLNSVSKDNSKKIEEAAPQLGRNEQEIRVITMYTCVFC